MVKLLRNDRVCNLLRSHSRVLIVRNCETLSVITVIWRLVCFVCSDYVHCSLAS